MNGSKYMLKVKNALMIRTNCIEIFSSNCQSVKVDKGIGRVGGHRIFND